MYETGSEPFFFLTGDINLEVCISLSSFASQQKPCTKWGSSGGEMCLP